MQGSIRNFSLAVAAFILTPTLALAHPGHDAAGFFAGFLHPFSGLDHMLAMTAVGFWAASLGGAARWIAPGAFLSLMALGGFAGMAGVEVPFVEYVVAASVVALGLLIAFDVRIPTAGAAALVALFAAFHGLAHGAEARAAASFASFAAGFIGATAALHAAGLGLGAWRFGGGGRLAGFAVAAAGLYLLASV